MQSYGNKPPRQSFRESDDFQKFRELVQNGFVEASTGLPKPDLLEFTEHLARILRRSDRRDTDIIKQFRHVFHQFKGLQQVHDTVKMEVELHMLKAQMAYADGRQTISRNFHLIIQESIDSILGCEDLPTQLPGLCGFFEALYGYYYYHTQRDKRRRRRN
jgi:CRISPR type III-A-associated protein Csm2